MPNHTIPASNRFFKDYDHDLQQLKRLVEDLECIAFRIQQVCLSLVAIHESRHLKDRE